MAKPKKIPFEVEPTEVKPGVWEWSTGQLKWRFSLGAGLNLCLVHERTGQLQPMVYVPDLKAAGYFTQGVEAGVTAKTE